MSNETMRSILREGVTNEDGRRIREILNKNALAGYVPANAPEQYLSFMNRHECSFSLCGAQSTNHPWYMGMFSIVSQHVYGDRVEECLDKAISIESRLAIR